MAESELTKPASPGNSGEDSKKSTAPEESSENMPVAQEHHEDDIQLSVEAEEELLINMEQDHTENTSKDEEKEGNSAQVNKASSTIASEPPTATGNIEDLDPEQYIWVRNLLLETKSEQLRNMFSKYGTVLKAKMMLDYNNLDVRVCGLVKMASKEEADKAIAAEAGNESHQMQVKKMEDKEMIYKLESLKASKKGSFKAPCAKSKSDGKSKAEQGKDGSQKDAQEGEGQQQAGEEELSEDQEENGDASKDDTKNADPHQYIWVSNLQLETKSEDLRRIFSKYGKVLKAKMLLDYNNYNVKICGYVKMASINDAEKALVELPKLYTPPNGMHVKMMADKEMIEKIESLKTNKKSVVAAHLPPVHMVPPPRPRPFPVHRPVVPPFYRPRPRERFWERERRIYFERMMMDRRERMWICDEQERVRKMQLEVMELKREMSKMIDETKRRQHLRAEKRPRDHEDVWQSRKKQAVSPYQSDDSRSSRSRYSSERERYGGGTTGASSSSRAAEWGEGGQQKWSRDNWDSRSTRQRNY